MRIIQITNGGGIRNKKLYSDWYNLCSCYYWLDYFQVRISNRSF